MTEELKKFESIFSLMKNQSEVDPQMLLERSAKRADLSSPFLWASVFATGKLQISQFWFSRLVQSTTGQKARPCQNNNKHIKNQIN